MSGPGKRLSNKELEFLENTIAGAICINHTAALAASDTDDLVILEYLDSISATAERMRIRTIAWMHKQKQGET